MATFWAEEGEFEVEFEYDEADVYIEDGAELIDTEDGDTYELGEELDDEEDDESEEE